MRDQDADPAGTEAAGVDGATADAAVDLEQALPGITERLERLGWGVSGISTVSGADPGDRPLESSASGPALSASGLFADSAVVMVVHADFAAPSRPAVTTLRELCRRRGGRVAGVSVDVGGEVPRLELLWGRRSMEWLPEIGSRQLLDALGIDLLPTWTRWEPVSGPSADDTWADAPVSALLSATGRLVGAQPKHVVDSALFSA